MSSIDFVDFYYSNVCGYTPDEDEQCVTANTITYLKDNGYADKEIARILLECGGAPALFPSGLPASLWEPYLTKPGQFYYHHTLQMTSKPPHYDVKLKKEIMEPYYMEMKIRFGMDDLIAYFYRELAIDLELMDKRRDSVRFASLLKKYERLSFVDSLDFVLSLIDFAKFAHQRVMSVFDIERNEADVFEELKRKAAEASFHGKNRIVWRQ